METTPGGSPTSSVPSMSKLTSFTPGIPHSLAATARGSNAYSRAAADRPANESLILAPMVVY